jgi:preprotein translocase subunit SecY
MQHIIEWIVGGNPAMQGGYVFVGNQIMEARAAIEATAQSLTSTFTFGGTTLLIMVGVAIETFRELEAQLTMRNYKGFLN